MCYRPPLWISPPVHVFSNVSPWTSQTQGMPTQPSPTGCPAGLEPRRWLSSAVIPRELEPRTVCVPRSAASPEAAGRDSRQASDKQWIRMTFPTPLITARLPPSVFLQSQSSQLVTRCLWYEAWSCESRTHWPSLSEVIRHWNPSWFHVGATGLSCYPTALCWRLLWWLRKWPITQTKRSCCPGPRYGVTTVVFYVFKQRYDASMT